jgi:hypothetical protein
MNDRYATDAFEDDVDVFRTTVGSAEQTASNYRLLSYWSRDYTIGGALASVSDALARVALYVGSWFPGEIQTRVRAAVLGPQIHANLRARVRANRKQVTMCVLLVDYPLCTSCPYATIDVGERGLHMVPCSY